MRIFTTTLTLALNTCFLSATPLPEQKAGATDTKMQESEDRNHAEKRAQVLKVRATINRLLSEDGNARAKLLDLASGGEGRFLGAKGQGEARIYAEELAFHEVLMLAPDGAEWDRMLARRVWLRVERSWVSSIPVVPLTPKKFDKRWAVERLDDHLRDLALGRCKDVASVLREIRIYDQLDRIPDDRREKLDRALFAAGDTIFRSNVDAAKLQFLLLLEAYRDYPSTLQVLVAKASTRASPEIEAQAMLVGPGRASGESPGPRRQMPQTYLAFFRLKNKETGIRSAAFIACTKLPANKRWKPRLDDCAFSILADETLYRTNPRLIHACLRYFATTPFRKENPSAAEWSELLTPILASHEINLRRALVDLPLHRFPASPHAKALLKALAQDPVARIRERAHLSLAQLDLVDADIDGLKSLLGENDPLSRVMLMKNLEKASAWNLDEATTVAFLPWAKTELESSKTHRWSMPSSYLQAMARNRKLHKFWLPFLLSIVKKEKGRVSWHARITLAAHGRLPESMAGLLHRQLPKAKGEEARCILSALHLHAIQNGDAERAAHYLDAFLHPGIEYEPPNSSSPIVWAALRAGGLTSKQKASLMEILALDLWTSAHNPCYSQWQAYASLGTAWSNWSTEIEDSVKSSTKDVRSKTEGWFESGERIRGLQLLLKAAGG